MARWSVPLVACVLLAFGLWAGDRVGWEGDDLASMFGISYLDRVGRDQVYRYAWQPLAYEGLHALGRVGVRFLHLTYVANIAGMLGLSLLMALLLRSLGPQTPRAPLVALLLVLAAPELWITALYFNSTALALPVFVASLLALQHAQRSGGMGSVALSGGLFGLSCLLRMDFAAAGLFVLLMVWWARHGRGPRAALAWLAGAAGAPLLMLLARPDLVSTMVGIVRGFEAGQQAWGVAQSAKVLVLTLGPAIVMLPLLWFWKPDATATRGQPRLSRAACLALGLSLLPMLAPLKNLYSGKYLVPLLCCVLWLVAQALGRRFATTPGPGLWRWRWRTNGAMAVLGLSLVVTAIPGPAAAGEGVWMRLFKPKPAFTHDGARSAGGYLQLASWFRTPEQRPPYMQVYLRLIDLVQACPGNVVVLFPADRKRYVNDPWTWGWLPLHLASEGWQLERYEPVEEVTLTAPGGGRSVRMLSAARYGTQADGAASVIDLGGAALQAGEDDPTATARFLLEPEQTGFCRSGNTMPPR